MDLDFIKDFERCDESSLFDKIVHSLSNVSEERVPFRIDTVDVDQGQSYRYNKQ
jgi:hypothetical protein